MLISVYFGCCSLRSINDLPLINTRHKALLWKLKVKKFTSFYWAQNWFFSTKISFKEIPYKSQHISSSILIFSFHLRLYVIKRFSSGFTKMFIGIYRPERACYMPGPCHTFRFFHLNVMCFRVKFKKFLMKVSIFPLPLRPCILSAPCYQTSLPTLSP